MNTKKFIEHLIKKSKYEKYDSMFVKELQGAKLILQLYRSRFGPSSILDCGVILEGYKARENRGPLDWHIWTRIETLSGDSVNHDIKNALDETILMNQEVRHTILESAFNLMELHMQSMWINEEWIEQFIVNPNRKFPHVNEYFLLEFSERRQAPH